jgi:hypothetical protein
MGRDGKFAFSDGIIQDIAKRRQAEENLLHEKAFTAVILDSFSIMQNA